MASALVRAWAINRLLGPRGERREATTVGLDVACTPLGVSRGDWGGRRRARTAIAQVSRAASSFRGKLSSERARQEADAFEGGHEAESAPASPVPASRPSATSSSARGAPTAPGPAGGRWHTSRSRTRASMHGDRGRPLLISFEPLLAFSLPGLAIGLGLNATRFWRHRTAFVGTVGIPPIEPLVLPTLAARTIALISRLRPRSRGGGRRSPRRAHGAGRGRVGRGPAGTPRCRPRRPPPSSTSGSPGPARAASRCG
jgi:hypothetical protein